MVKRWLRESLINKKGQVAIYVIVAIVIVGLITLGVLFRGQISSTLGGQEFSPNAYLKDCVEPEINEKLGVLLKQGGYLNPEGYILYNGEKVKYLCYTAKYYETCVVQEPMIKNHIEAELQRLISAKANSCLQSLKTEYEKRGYSVSSSAASSQISIIPGRIRVDFLTPMSITKETTETFKGFESETRSELYELLFVAQSIIDFESSYGDSETSLYLQYYSNLKIEKEKTDDGSTVYKLSNVVTKEEFVFASRSLAWPPGFGLEGTQ